MKKTKIGLLFTVLFMLVFAGTVFAGDFVIVDYQDTASDFDSDAGDTPGSLIRNGAFDDWTGNNCHSNADLPDHWCVWPGPGSSTTGWDVHAGRADMAFGGEGVNDGLTFFIQTAGATSGGRAAGAYQQLDQITQAGYYFVSVSEAIWYIGQTGRYNSVAWYAISPSSDPAAVTDWRELDPYVIQCSNLAESCVYAGRDETVWVNPGDYLHLRVEQKFSVHQGATVFVIDDISIVSIGGGTGGTNNGYYNWINDSADVDGDGGDEKWHFEEDEEPVSDDPVEVHWEHDAAR
jgi:hypothetical protein